MSEHNTEPRPNQKFTPLEGLENVTFTLPNADDHIGSSDTLHDDWKVHESRATDSGNIKISLHRTDAKGDIADTRIDIPAKEFMEYRELQEPLRRDRAVRRGMLSQVSESRRDVAELVRGTEKYKRLRALGDVALLDIEDDRRQKGYIK